MLQKELALEKGPEEFLMPQGGDEAWGCRDKSLFKMRRVRLPLY